MWIPARILAVLLILGSSGIVPTLASLAVGGAEDCLGAGASERSDEEHDGPCSGCSDSCSLCICCPLRCAPAPRGFVVASAALCSRSLSCAAPAPALSGVGTDIFHPPRG
jgi:hypothetical protein